MICMKEIASDWGKNRGSFFFLRRKLIIIRNSSFLLEDVFMLKENEFGVKENDIELNKQIEKQLRK